MIIKFEPHGFVIFLTLAMGMVYAISNSRSGWGFWKVALTAIFVLPTLYYGFVIGRAVEVVLGSIVGWFYGRGGISLPHFRLNPFGKIGNWLRNRKYDREQMRDEKRKKREQFAAKKKQKSSSDEEIKRRKEQAKKSRKNTEPQYENAESSDDNQKYSENKEGQAEPPKQNRPRQKVEQKLDMRTTREILGVSPDATQTQIKKAYAVLRSRYHPDKYAHMSVEFVKEAENELKKINNAWAQLKR